MTRLIASLELLFGEAIPRRIVLFQQGCNLHISAGNFELLS